MASILLVEDDGDIAIVMDAILRDEGHDVLHAETARDGLALVQNRRIDVIISDLVPEPSAEGRWRPVRELRRALPNVPILVCTAHPMTSLDPAQVNEVSGILLKPFGYEELVGCVTNILANRTQCSD